MISMSTNVESFSYSLLSVKLSKVVLSCRWNWSIYASFNTPNVSPTYRIHKRGRFVSKAVASKFSMVASATKPDSNYYIGVSFIRLYTALLKCSYLSIHNSFKFNLSSIDIAVLSDKLRSGGCSLMPWYICAQCGVEWNRTFSLS